ncbi:hypothetical protein PFISCL1PPCAC_4815, partial [Pristionchus fissidentatus]
DMDFRYDNSAWIHLPNFLHGAGHSLLQSSWRYETMMQGVIILMEDVVLFFGPFYASRIFKAFSLSALWIVNVSVVGFGLIVFLATFKR